MSIFAFVFARGESKGLPGKNVKILGDKPLICHSIETAKQVSGVERVFVSTEDAEIAEIAKAAGAEIIECPASLAEDSAREWLAWKLAIGWVEARYGVFNTFVSLPTTSPLRAVVDVNNAISKRIEAGADVCISVTKASRNPCFNMVKRSAETDSLSWLTRRMKR